MRHNLEALFQSYQANVPAYTRSLLTKLHARTGDIKAEIIDLFAARLLNFIRNPFSIVKVLNTFPAVTACEPADPTLLAIYRRIKNGRKPHQAFLCNELGISDAQYVEWLQTMFMLLMPLADGRPALFDEMIKTLLEDKQTYIAAFVYEYDNNHCLLSDRGFSQPIAEEPHLAFSFNLNSTAFINYIFASPAALVSEQVSPEFIEEVLGLRERLPEKRINVSLLHNHLEALKMYNRRVVEQCHNRVYCAKKDGILLRIEYLLREGNACFQFLVGLAYGR